MEKKKSEFGIWAKQVKMKTGETTQVLNFSVNGVRYNAWPNKYKSSEKSPDFNVYIDTYVKPEGAPNPNYQGKTTNTPLSDNRTFSPGSHNTSEDSLPF
jgi:hypothetical protein